MFKKGVAGGRYGYFFKGDMNAENRSVGHPHHHNHNMIFPDRADSPRDREEEKRRNNALERASKH